MKHLLLFSILYFLTIQSFSQETISGEIMHDEILREYIIYVPETYNPAFSTPLILNFHGYTSNSLEQMFYGDFRDIADTTGILVVHPQGTVDNFGNTHWNVGWGTSIVDDVGFTSALIDSLSADYNINPERIYSTGMSNGGFMSYHLACNLNDRIAAIASVTGSMTLGLPVACNAEPPKPVMEIHGTADDVVPYEGNFGFESIADVLSFWVDLNNCDAEAVITQLPDLDPDDGSTVEHQLYPNGIAGSVVEHFKIIGGGHTWPGAFFDNGGTNYDIDASVEIWQFFSKYDINGLIIQTATADLTMENEKSKIYPNPAVSVIHLDSKYAEPQEFSVYNTMGSLVISGLTNSSLHPIDIAHLPVGMYLLKTQNQTHKFFKTN